MSSNAQSAGTHYQVMGVHHFLLVGSQRSGTNFLREFLNTNPSIAVHGEVLLPYPTPTTWHNFVRNMATQQVVVTPDEAAHQLDEYLIFLAEQTRRDQPGKAGQLAAVGIDVKYNQLRFIQPVLHALAERPYLFLYLQQRGIRVLHMTRRNTIHQALSLAIAEARNVYHNYGTNIAPGKVKLDANNLLAHARWVADDVAVFRRAAEGLNVLDVAYEDIVATCETADGGGKIPVNDELTDTIRKHLGCYNSFRRPETLHRVIDKPYDQVIANHTEIVKAIQDSPFAEFAPTI